MNTGQELLISDLCCCIVFFVDMQVIMHVLRPSRKYSKKYPSVLRQFPLFINNTMICKYPKQEIARKELLGLMKSFLFFSRTRSSSNTEAYHPFAPAIVPLSQYIAYLSPAPPDFTRVIYMNYVHEHIRQYILVFMPTVGLHSAVPCFMEFVHVRDLWTELNTIKSLMPVQS